MAIAKTYPAAKVVGLDIDPTSIERANAEVWNGRGRRTSLLFAAHSISTGLTFGPLAFLFVQLQKSVLRNVEFVCLPMEDYKPSEAFDFAFIYNCIHDMRVSIRRHGLSLLYPHELCPCMIIS